MKRLILSLLAISLSLIVAAAPGQFIDNTTGVVLNYGEAQKVDTISLSKSKKLIIQFPKSSMAVYSEKAPDGKEITWEYINDYDAKEPRPIVKEKTGDNAEGWIRVYPAKDKNGRQYYVCYALIKGSSKYCFVTQEFAYDSTDLRTREIIAASEFPDSDPDKAARERSRMPLSSIFIWLAIALSPLALWKYRKNFSWVVVASITAAVAIVSFVYLYAICYGTLWGAIIFSIVALCIALFALLASSFDSFLDVAKKVFDEIK